MLVWKLAFLALLATGVARAQTLQIDSTLPQIKGKTLDDQEIALPEISAGKVTLLIFTFSKAAGEHGRVWNDHFIKDYPQDDQTTSYAIAVLGDVPSLFRGMVRSAIKRSVPPALRRRFITLVKDEGQWKQYVGLRDDKEVYIVLLDGKGRVQWVQHGLFDQAVFDMLKTKITELLRAKQN